jgi:hypothetical protein
VSSSSRRSEPRRRPAPAHSAVTEAFDDELVVYCERSQRLHCLDRRASLIWALCDGTRDVDGIVREAASAAGVDPSMVSADVESTIREFHELGLLR